jgi:pimeloyl-ACP methyl ester carboxylesterase
VIAHPRKIDTTRCSQLAIAILGALTLSGCAVVPTSPLCADVAARCDTCRDSVHIVFVHSPVDAGDVDGLSKVADLFCEAGFKNTTTFNLYHDGSAEALACRVREIHAGDPGARVMLIGYSSGALIARGAAKRLEADGICIDTLVYLDAAILHLARDEEPCNVLRHVLIYREGTPIPDVGDNAVIHRVEEWNHLRVPTTQSACDKMLSEAIHLVDSRGHREAPSDPALPTPKLPYQDVPTLRIPDSAAQASAQPRVILLPAPRSQPAWFKPGGIEVDGGRIASVPR